MSTTKILNILEAANIEPPKARAIAESLELAFREQEEDLSEKLMTKLDGVDLRRELDVKIEGTKAEIIKWMSLFWLGQIAVTAGLIKFLAN